MPWHHVNLLAICPCVYGAYIFCFSTQLPIRPSPALSLQWVALETEAGKGFAPPRVAACISASILACCPYVPMSYALSSLFSIISTVSVFFT